MTDDKNKLKKMFGVTVLYHVGDGARSRCWCAHNKNREVLLLKHVQIETEKDHRWVEQLESEHEIAERFDHPNIRGSRSLVYYPSKRNATDVGLMMDFVDGVPLNEWIQKNHPELPQLLEIFIACADALNHMHIDRFVHADMKPNNVLMDASTDKPIIIDFGQACRLLTEKERVQGTPGYIAPEQVKRRKVTYLTDVFNLGATMYHLLTGRQIDTEKFTQPPALTGVPTALSDLILKCVEPEPNDRPTMKEVRDSLRRILPEASPK